MQVKNALNWKIFVFLLCDINQQYQRVLDTRSNTSYPPGGEIRDIDHIGSLALANHLDDQQGLAFKAGEIEDAAAWFVERIGFAAAAPNLVGQGYIFKGGRPCKLGPKGAAYLFYEKNGKKCSLFVINPDDIKFKFKNDKKYFLAEKSHDIKVWSESGLVYAMVN